MLQGIYIDDIQNHGKQEVACAMDTKTYRPVTATALTLALENI